MNRVHILAILGTLALGGCATLLVSSQEVAPSTAAGDQLFIAASKTTLGVGESAQLAVTLKRAYLSVVDVTDTSTGTRYFTTSESMLVPESDGRITCVGTDDKPVESANISVHYGKAYSYVRVHLQANGPGPTLEILPKKTTLQEGESVRFQVLSKDKADLTARSSGSRYLVFSGDGVPDPDVIHIDDESGVLTALKSLGKYQQLHPIIFVRNGDLVGWLGLRIVRKGDQTE
jgi:hypothetical protein